MLLAVAVAAQAQNPYRKFTEKLPFQMPEVSAPVIPDRQVSLKSFGAVGDGLTLNTKAFSKAIDALSKKGGGRLVVPQGVWFTGPIVLKSNIELYLEDGAVIQFSGDEELYPIINTSFEGLDTRRCQSPLSANGAENIAITGHGVIDGNGQFWRPVKRSKVTDAQWKEIMERPGGVEMKKGYWVPNQGYVQGETGANMNVPNAQTEEEWNAIKRFLRPVMISLVNCKNVLLQGVIFQNSPAWNIHPLMCENIIIDNVLARNPSYAQNGDALDLESCKNALIVNSKRHLHQERQGCRRTPSWSSLRECRRRRLYRLCRSWWFCGRLRDEWRREEHSRGKLPVLRYGCRSALQVDPWPWWHCGEYLY